MWTKFLASIAIASSLVGQTQRPEDSLKVHFPAGSPVTVISSGWGESRATARGGALVVDVRTSLKLKNASHLRLRGISLQVSSQEVAAGGKASVSVPSLDVAPGQDFPVRIDLRLLQPNGSGPAIVAVDLDGVLFEDLSFFGANRLGSRRQLTAWELEARRDRNHLKQIFARGGEEGLRRSMLEMVARENNRPKLDVRLARSPAALPNSHNVEIAFLSQDGVPVHGVRASAVASGNEFRIPELVFENRADREVASIELGLIVRDQEGREFSAGALPAALPMKAKASGTVQPATGIQLKRSQGTPLNIESVSGFVQQVEFADGQIWIPPSSFRDQARLTTLIPGSVEEQRLSDIYRRRGMPALLEELNKQ